MKTLDEIAIEHGTDKATKHPHVAHGYAPVYEWYFSSRRHLPIKLLEIGVGGGESIRTWLDYFPKAQVVGVDIVENTNPWNTRNSGAHERYRFCQGSQDSKIFWKCFLADYGNGWDIIIDDGGHMNSQIVISYQGLWPAVAPGGMYCIEDLGVDTPGSAFVDPKYPTHHALLSSLLTSIDSGKSDITEVSYTRELAILKKQFVLKL